MAQALSVTHCTTGSGVTTRMLTRGPCPEHSQFPCVVLVCMSCGPGTTLHPHTQESPHPRACSSFQSPPAFTSAPCQPGGDPACGLWGGVGHDLSTSLCGWWAPSCICPELCSGPSTGGLVPAEGCAGADRCRESGIYSLRRPARASCPTCSLPVVLWSCLGRVCSLGKLPCSPPPAPPPHVLLTGLTHGPEGGGCWQGGCCHLP